jgi:hypothetical protein
MKLILQPLHIRIRRIPAMLLAIASFALVALSPSLLHAQAPGWWQQRGIKNGAAADDFAVINQGQVKNLVRGAVFELSARLPGGAGAPLFQLLDQWAHPTTPAPDDYAVANLGQLKAAAVPVYDRLITLGYVTGYPWVGASDNYAMANIGQAKALFAFDFLRDSDGDGYSDEAELAAGTNPFSAASKPQDADADGISDADEALFGLNPNANDAAVPGSSITYTYDKTNRLLGATGLTTVTISYDGEGNVQNTAQSQ